MIHSTSPQPRVSQVVELSLAVRVLDVLFFAGVDGRLSWREVQRVARALGDRLDDEEGS